MSPRKRVISTVEQIDRWLDIGIKFYRFLQYEIKSKQLRNIEKLPDSPYRILGFEPSTPLEEKKRRYRQIARLVHPDKGGDEQLAKLINQAWEEVCRREGIK